MMMMMMMMMMMLMITRRTDSFFRKCLCIWHLVHLCACACACACACVCVCALAALELKHFLQFFVFCFLKPCCCLDWNNYNLPYECQQKLLLRRALCSACLLCAEIPCLANGDKHRLRLWNADCCHSSLFHSSVWSISNDRGESVADVNGLQSGVPTEFTEPFMSTHAVCCDMLLRAFSKW